MFKKNTPRRLTAEKATPIIKPIFYENRRCGDQTKGALSESSGCWDPGRTPIRKWTAEGAGKNRIAD
ncbi:hypothetical protein HMP0721_0202 [Pseudoramibacter alactolyticus ATCC 23263]|uniref:Uncharacterized protein n=1 Tax=Pseudoramibacter alactolyticus ATCC 23263 TaxID=887929 RepID=E6MDW9_9FIRM|nr:hypothetical protein HMP0721_0202 [Pseudoramibacter alactolyticus ATCC 23263]